MMRSKISLATSEWMAIEIDCNACSGIRRAAQVGLP